MGTSTKIQKSGGNFMVKKNKPILIIMLLISIVMSLTVLTGCIEDTLDENWIARTYTEKDGSTAIRIYEPTKKGKKLTELTIPEEIAGYPVKLLKPKAMILGGLPGSAEFGSVKHVTIEGCVRVEVGFFAKDQVEIVEFTNPEPSYAFIPFSGSGIDRTKPIIIIIPDGSVNFIQESSKYPYTVYHKSEYEALIQQNQ
jgi:hypothetical protein